MNPANDNPPVWCFKIMVTTPEGTFCAHRTGPLYVRPKDAKRAAAVWALNLACKRRFPAGTTIQPQTFRRRAACY